MAKIKKEDIIDQELIKTIERFNYQVQKLDEILGKLAAKYNIPSDKMFEFIQQLQKSKNTDVLNILQYDYDKLEWFLKNE